ncbi:MAG: YdbL family protein [Opitutaceae bacterium]|nr:YdbL family protein [Opitutaceae bacterium]
MKLTRIVLLAWIASLLGLATAVGQEDQAAIAGRIKARVAQVDELKLAQIVGENNKGFLEQRGQLSPEQTQVMNAENTDRRALYNIIATRNGVTVAVVGAQRAEQIRNTSAAGVWLQAGDGSWYKK